MTNNGPKSNSESADSMLSMLAEHSRDIIWHMQFPADLTYVSPACERILGWTPIEQIRRSGVVQMLTSESEAHVARMTSEALASRSESLTYEAEHLCKDGSTVWCEVHVGFVYGDDGAALSCIGISRDITEQRKLRDRVIDSERRHSVATLAGAIAHNLNNDLSIILGTLELLQNETDSRLVDGALSAINRAAAMTRQMLTFGSHQPSQVQILDMNLLVENQLDTMRNLLSEAVALEFVSAPGGAPVKCDLRQIEQILFNLVINARDALAAGTQDDPKVTITVATREMRSRRLVSLSISDNGPGMDSFTKARAFEPFFTSKPNGSGLGLASTRNIAEQHGATVTLQSELNRGTRVELVFPLADGKAERSISYDFDKQEGLQGDESILLVEDETGVRDVLSHVLSRSGYTVHAYATAREALAALPDLQIDLLLADIVLPDFDGRQLAIEVRQRNPGLPVVFVTGYVESAEDLNGQVLPGPLITKPIYNIELLSTLRACLQAV